MLSKTRFDEIFHMSGRSPSHLLWFSRYHQITVNLANCSFIKKTDNFKTRITFATVNIFGSGLKRYVGIDLLYITPHFHVRNPFTLDDMLLFVFLQKSGHVTTPRDHDDFRISYIFGYTRLRGTFHKSGRSPSHSM